MTRRRRDWVVGALAGLAGIGATVGFAFLVVGLVDGGEDPSDGANGETPTQVGEDMRVVIAADGTVEVTQRFVVPKLVASVRLRPGPAYGAPGAVEDIRVTSAGASVSTSLPAGRGGQPVALGRPVLEFGVTFRVAAPAPVESVGGSPSAVAGRSLVVVPMLDVDYANESGPVHREIVAEGEILNVACVRSETPPRPCGVRTEDGWEVDLAGRNRDVGLVVQVQDG